MEDELQRRHLLDRLATERAALLEGLLGLDETTLTEKPVVGEPVENSDESWAVKEILAHIAAWERWEERTMRCMAAGDAPDFSALGNFAVTNAAFVAPWRDRGLDGVLDELMAARSDWLCWLESLSDKEFFQPRAYSGQAWTFSETPLQIHWHHDAEHAEQIAGWRGPGQVKEATGPTSVLLAALEAARQELLAAAALIPAQERTSRPICGEWTAKDVVGHIADWEWYCVEGLRLMAAGQPPDSEPIGDIEDWNASHVDARRDQPWQVVWDDLHDARHALLDVLQRMSQTTMTQSFSFPWGSEGTPYQWTRVFLGHDREHARDLRPGDQDED